MLSPAEQARTTFQLPRLVQAIHSACLALEHPLSNQFRHFFVHFSSNSIDFSTFHAHVHLFLVTITHPSISINFLSSSIDFRICPMPLGQQSITPLCHAPPQLDPGELSHTRIHLTTDRDSTQLNAPPHVGNTEYSLTQTSPTSTDISGQAGMVR